MCKRWVAHRPMLSYRNYAQPRKPKNQVILKLFKFGPIFFTFVSFLWCIEMFLFSPTSCITTVVSYIFIEILKREIGAWPAKIHITYACPTFHCCDALIEGESPYTFLSYFKRKGQNYLSCFWGRVRSCARAFRLCRIKARLFLISFGDTSLTNESIPKLKLE